MSEKEIMSEGTHSMSNPITATVASGMREALDRLVGEVAACWGMDETLLRRELGNTNYQIVLDRLADARAALSTSSVEDVVAALESIRDQNEYEIALDPDWPRRVACAALSMRKNNVTSPEVVALRKALELIERLGNEGMKPDYREWLTFHDKIARIAHEALISTSSSAVD